MNSKNKTNPIPKDILKELQGFEEVFEDYIENESQKDAERKKKDLIKDLDNYELQRFLELENERLTKLENFLTKKIPIKVNFSQEEKLLQIQTEKKEKLKDELILEMMVFDSAFMRNLSLIFNAHFS